MKNARALDRIAEYAGLPLEDFVMERRLQNAKKLSDTLGKFWSHSIDKSIAHLRIYGHWERAFEVDFSDLQKGLDEAKELLAQIQSDTTLIEKMEADSHEQV